MILYTQISVFVEGYHGRVLPGGCAHDAQSFILTLDRVELELEDLGDIPDEGEDLSHTVLDGRHHCKEVHGSLRDRLRFLCTCDQNSCKVKDEDRTNLQVHNGGRG